MKRRNPTESTVVSFKQQVNEAFFIFPRSAKKGNM